jgi:FixJ family two-component response regulator
MGLRNPMPEGTVYLVDDDTEVRDGLGRLLRLAGRQVVACASADEFLQQLPITTVGCIVLDVTMPGMSGPQLHEQLQALGVDLPVIYLTGQGSVPLSVRAMKRGAFDFLEKPIDAGLLFPLLDQAFARHRQDREVQQRSLEIARRLGELSPREREVMDLVISGRMNKQIAGDLRISEKTVKAHRGRVMAKFGARSVAELVKLCGELGLATPPALRRPRSPEGPM